MGCIEPYENAARHTCPPNPWTSGDDGALHCDSHPALRTNLRIRWWVKVQVVAPIKGHFHHDHDHELNTRGTLSLKKTGSSKLQTGSIEICMNHYEIITFWNRLDIEDLA